MTSLLRSACLPEEFLPYKFTRMGRLISGQNSGYESKLVWFKGKNLIFIISTQMLSVLPPFSKGNIFKRKEFATPEANSLRAEPFGRALLSSEVTSHNKNCISFSISVPIHL